MASKETIPTKKREVKIFNGELPSDVIRLLRVRAAERGVLMRDLLAECITSHLNGVVGSQKRSGL
jgi:hypothetical protein